MEQWKRNLFILWGAVFLLMAAMTSIMPFLPLYIEQDMDVHPDKASFWAGLVFGANFLSAFIFSPIWGKVADRYGRKLMILRSGFGMAIVIASMGFATNVYQLLFLRFLNGIIAGFNPSAIALVATSTPKEKTGYALGILQSGAVAGSILGPMVGGFLADHIGFRQIFFYTGAFIFVAAIIVLIFVKEDFVPETSSQRKGFIADFKIIASTQPLLSFFFVSFLIQFAALSVLPILSLYIKGLGVPEGSAATYAGIVAGTTGIANMIASPYLGKLGDKHGSQKILFYSLIGAAIFFIPQGFSSSVWELMVWRFLLGITLGGLLPAVNSLVRHYAPKGMESRTYGYSNSAVFLGNMLGPIVGGYLGGVIGYTGVFVFTGVLLLINSLWVKLHVFKRIDAVKLQQVEGNS